MKKSLGKWAGILGILCFSIGIFLVQAQCAGGDEGSSGSSGFAATGSEASVLRTRIVAAPNKCSESKTAEFSFKCNLPPCTFRCNVDDLGWDRCRKNSVFELEVGDHVLRVKARNSEGLKDLTPAAYSWIIRKDGDGDGFSECSNPVADCADLDGSIFPGAVEICDDAIDQDCNGFDLPCTCGTNGCEKPVERANNCPIDCAGSCGDDICNPYFENANSCPKDCN